ncbi:hypothetical protein BDD12DRAFT_806419 [Trichophaea hybrida]|nr:hypothetical protein BDD12DRAFT_806419 [Trichophaea hybrida]
MAASNMTGRFNHMFQQMGLEYPDVLVDGIFQSHHEAFPEASQQWLRDMNDYLKGLKWGLYSQEIFEINGDNYQPLIIDSVIDKMMEILHANGHYTGDEHPPVSGHNPVDSGYNDDDEESDGKNDCGGFPVIDPVLLPSVGTSAALPITQVGGGQNPTIVTRPDVLREKRCSREALCETQNRGDLLSIQRDVQEQLATF